MGADLLALATRGVKNKKWLPLPLPSSNSTDHFLIRNVTTHTTPLAVPLSQITAYHTRRRKGRLLLLLLLLLLLRGPSARAAVHGAWRAASPPRPRGAQGPTPHAPRPPPPLLMPRTAALALALARVCTRCAAAVHRV
jgi:hypothetical protein